MKIDQYLANIWTKISGLLFWPTWHFGPLFGQQWQ